MLGLARHQGSTSGLALSGGGCALVTVCEDCAPRAFHFHGVAGTSGLPFTGCATDGEGVRGPARGIRGVSAALRSAPTAPRWPPSARTARCASSDWTT